MNEPTKAPQIDSPTAPAEQQARDAAPDADRALAPAQPPAPLRPDEEVFSSVDDYVGPLC